MARALLSANDAQKPRAALREAVASDVVARLRNLNYQASADMLSLRPLGTFVILPS